MTEGVTKGSTHQVYTALGEELAQAGYKNGNDQSGKWIVGKVYYCVERTIDGGWEIDDPTYIFDSETEAMGCFNRLEAIDQSA